MHDELERIARLLDDQQLRERVGAAGRSRVMDRFTWTACAKATAEQYRIVLEERGRQAPC